MSCSIYKDQQAQKEDMRAIRDSMDVLNGKWKIAIITSICQYNKRRFSEILADVEGISNKMLSKELRELEMDKLVERTVLDTYPVTIQYELTQHGKTLQTIVDSLTAWGRAHRQEVLGQPTSATVTI